jgi:periplasmic protein TonB
VHATQRSRRRLAVAVALSMAVHAPLVAPLRSGRAGLGAGARAAPLQVAIVTRPSPSAAAPELDAPDAPAVASGARPARQGRRYARPVPHGARDGGLSPAPLAAATAVPELAAAVASDAPRFGASGVLADRSSEVYARTGPDELAPGIPAPRGAGSPWLAEHQGSIERHLQAWMDLEPYPLEAKRRGWRGTADVGFTIRRDGSVGDVRVVRSSGHAVLDRCAVKVVFRAAPFRRPPADQEVIVPFEFDLRGM